MTEVDRSTIWPYDERGEPRQFFYARYDHPAGVEAETELGRLEDGDALLFASGTAAATAVVLAFARPGMTIALAERCYFGTGVLFQALESWGLRLVEFDQTLEPPAADIVWVEAPANPGLTMPNWEALRAHGGLVVCDATVATPVYLRSLDEGASVVVYSATKFLTGTHNALLGAAVTRDPELGRTLREFRTKTGAIAAPDAAATLTRSLATLDNRMRQHTRSATEIARRLESHAKVQIVRYPGFSGLIAFDVAAADVRTIETSTRLIANATSLGGERSTMESRARWEGERIPAGLLRLSVGLEDVEEIWADLEQALDAT